MPTIGLLTTWPSATGGGASAGAAGAGAPAAGIVTTCGIAAIANAVGARPVGPRDPHPLLALLDLELRDAGRLDELNQRFELAQIHVPSPLQVGAPRRWIGCGRRCVPGNSFVLVGSAGDGGNGSRHAESQVLPAPSCDCPRVRLVGTGRCRPSPRLVVYGMAWARSLPPMPARCPALTIVWPPCAAVPRAASAPMTALRRRRRHARAANGRSRTSATAACPPSTARSGASFS